MILDATFQQAENNAVNTYGVRVTLTQRPLTYQENLLPNDGTLTSQGSFLSRYPHTWHNSRFITVDRVLTGGSFILAIMERGRSVITPSGLSAGPFNGYTTTRLGSNFLPNAVVDFAIEGSTITTFYGVGELGATNLVNSIYSITGTSMSTWGASVLILTSTRPIFGIASMGASDFYLIWGNTSTGNTAGYNTAQLVYFYKSGATWASRELGYETYKQETIFQPAADIMLRGNRFPEGDMLFLLESGRTEVINSYSFTKVVTDGLHIFDVTRYLEGQLNTRDTAPFQPVDYHLFMTDMIKGSTSTLIGVKYWTPSSYADKTSVDLGSYILEFAEPFNSNAEFFIPGNNTAASQNKAPFITKPPGITGAIMLYNGLTTAGGSFPGIWFSITNNPLEVDLTDDLISVSIDSSNFIDIQMGNN